MARQRASPTRRSHTCRARGAITYICSASCCEYAICVLLAKPSRYEVDLRPDLIGFEIPDAFVVGYGLDVAENYRELDAIRVFEPE